MKYFLVLLILIGFAGSTSLTLISAYGDGKTISGDYMPISNGIISLDDNLFFISKSFAIQTEANRVESFHGVNFTIPYDPNPPVPGGIRSATIVFSDGITEELSRGMRSDIETTLSNHIWPIAGFSRHLDNTFYFLVSIDSEPPLKQFKSGIESKDVVCKQGLELVMKKSNGQPICVKSTSVRTLTLRNYIPEYNGAFGGEIPELSIKESKDTPCIGSAMCFTGDVEKIVDGDTLVIDGKRIRLSLTNTPERGEGGFSEATEFTRFLCPVGSKAQVDQDDLQPYDQYNRTLGKVVCSGKVLNSELLENGHAEILTQYCSKSEFSSEPWAIKFGWYCG